jgi:hypothetical protein
MTSQNLSVLHIVATSTLRSRGERASNPLRWSSWQSLLVLARLRVTTVAHQTCIPFSDK